MGYKDYIKAGTYWYFSREIFLERLIEQIIIHRFREIAVDEDGSIDKEKEAIIQTILDNVGGASSDNTVAVLLDVKNMNVGTKTSDGKNIVATKMKEVVESLYMGAQSVDK